MQSEEEKQLMFEREQADFQKGLSIRTLIAVPFLALNHYDRLFLVPYTLVAVTLLIYKNSRYPLPSYALSCEAIVVVMQVLTQLMRYWLGKRGVLNKESRSMVVYLLGSLFVFMNYVFGVRLQTYVTLLEVVTNSAGMVLVGLQAMAAAWILKVYQHTKEVS